MAVTVVPSTGARALPVTVSTLLRSGGPGTGHCAAVAGLAAGSRSIKNPMMTRRVRRTRRCQFPIRRLYLPRGDIIHQGGGSTGEMGVRRVTQIFCLSVGAVFDNGETIEEWLATALKGPGDGDEGLADPDGTPDLHHQRVSGSQARLAVGS